MDISANQTVDIDLDFTKFEFPFDNLQLLKCYNFKLINISNINTNVTYLIFNNVSWTSIKSYYFTDLINVHALNIFSNNISIIHNYTFKDLINLSDLALHLNNITYIESGAFYGLVRLEYLNLDSNALVELNMDIFNIYNKLQIFQYISITRNPIKSIKSGIFISNNIKGLYLSDNYIDSIEINAFNVKLKILKIHSSNAQHIFVKLKKIKIDTLLNHTIMCNCQTFNTFNHSILKLMNISKHYYIGCIQIKIVAMTCTHIKGKYIYIYIYIYITMHILLYIYIYIYIYIHVKNTYT